MHSFDYGSAVSLLEASARSGLPVSRIKDLIYEREWFKIRVHKLLYISRSLLPELLRLGAEERERGQRLVLRIGTGRGPLAAAGRVSA